MCIYNRRNVTLKERKRRINIEKLNVADWEDVTIWSCDVHHFFAETISKGKKNDHQMHLTCLRALIKEYIQIFDELGHPLECIIIWTDNAPNQYRCRQNFAQISSISENFPGINIIHRLAVVDNFKGNHDAVGKDPARLIRSLELSGIRSESAYKVFANRHRLEKKREDSEWLEYEIRGDVALKRKGKYGMDSRTVWYVVESQEEYDRLSVQYHGRVLLCDRTFTLDTLGGKSIPDNKSLHEVRSVATQVPEELPYTWPLRLSNLPCNCKYCVVNPSNNDCKISTWRRTRDYNMKLVGVSPAHANSWVGSGVCMKAADGLVIVGLIVAYVHGKTQTWSVQFGETVHSWTYEKVYEAKSLFMKTMVSGSVE